MCSLHKYIQVIADKYFKSMNHTIADTPLPYHLFRLGLFQDLPDALALTSRT